MAYRLSQHAREEMARRSLPPEFVDQVMSAPQQTVPEQKGRKAYQSKLDFGGGRILLLRLIVVDDIEPAVVVTRYRTSKIAKYWK